MTRLLLGNIEPGTTDDEVSAFLEKYGFPPFEGIEHAPGDGSQPAVLLNYESADPLVIDKLRERIHEMYWRGRKLSAQILRDRFA